MFTYYTKLRCSKSINIFQNYNFTFLVTECHKPLNKCYLLILMILRANGALALSKCEKNVQGIPGLHRYI